MICLRVALASKKNKCNARKEEDRVEGWINVTKLQHSWQFSFFVLAQDKTSHGPP